MPSAYLVLIIYLMPNSTHNTYKCLLVPIVATRPSCSAPYKKNGTASQWTFSEVLWSQCLEEWRLSSSRRATRLNIRPSLFFVFSVVYLLVLRNKLWILLLFLVIFQTFFRYWYSRFDMYGAGSIPAGDHNSLPLIKCYPNQLIFCTREFIICTTQ